MRNKGHLKPIDIIPAQHKELKDILRKAELRYILGADVVQGLTYGSYANGR